MALARARPGDPVNASRTSLTGVVLLGVVTTGASSTLMDLARSSASTTVVFRCLFALPLLLAVAACRGQRVPRTALRPAVAAGTLLGVDLLLWDYAIDDVGAGLSTVLQDVHVVIVVLLAWALLGQRVPRRTAAALPVLLVGVVLVSGLAGGGATGPRPLRGTVLALASAVAYAGFVTIVSARRPGGAVPFLVVVTAATAVTGVVFGQLGGTLDLTPGRRGLLWLLVLAVVTQVVGWVVLTEALAGTPAAHASVLLLLQPVAALGYALVLLGETPSAAQLVGVVLILGCVAAVTSRTRPVARLVPVLEAA